MEELACIADDDDFASLKRLVDNDEGWSLEVCKANTLVWTRSVPGCNFQMVKINSRFEDIDPDCVFDVLLDPDYRKEWDSHMLESFDIGNFNVNNDVGYYAMSCPPPLKPRDFVLLRSWLDTGLEQMLLSRSIIHKDFPPKKGFVRAVSHITGFIIRQQRNSGCRVGYIAHCDPQGTLPPWLVNKVTHSLGPRMVKDLRKAALGYKKWKTSQPHHRKPWRFPEEIITPRISVLDCQIPESFINSRKNSAIESLPSSQSTSASKPEERRKKRGGSLRKFHRMLPKLPTDKKNFCTIAFILLMMVKNQNGFFSFFVPTEKIPCYKIFLTVSASA